MGKKIALSASVEFLYPAPVLLVTCIDKDSRANIITIAWAGVCCSEPPVVSISVRPSRYSHKLIIRSLEFGINIPRIQDLQKVDFCGVASGEKVDKFEKCRFTPFKGKFINAPLIKECPVNMECKVIQSIDLGSHTLFLARIETVYVDEELMENKEFKAFKADPIVYLPPTAEYASIGKLLGRYCLSKGRI